MVSRCGKLARFVMLALLAAFAFGMTQFSNAATPAEAATLTNPLNAERAYGYLKQICALGPRTSGSIAMRRQQQILRDHFAGLGGQVTFQRFMADNPLEGAKVPMANMLVQWHPERTERILIAAHYDTRPFPDRDPDKAK